MSGCVGSGLFATVTGADGRDSGAGGFPQPASGMAVSKTTPSQQNRLIETSATYYDPALPKHLKRLDEDDHDTAHQQSDHPDQIKVEPRAAQNGHPEFFVDQECNQYRRAEISDGVHSYGHRPIERTV